MCPISSTSLNCSLLYKLFEIEHGRHCVYCLPFSIECGCQFALIRVIRSLWICVVSQKNHHLLVNNHTFLFAMSPKRSIFVGT